MRVIIAIAITLGGCVRDPAETFCPEVVLGDLAVTEVRAQPSGDTLGSWVEVYNASGHPLDLRGVELRFRKMDGTSETKVIVRRSLPLAAGAYAVLGRVTDDELRPSFVDYGFAADFPAAWPSAAALDINACGELIDRVTYSSLPTMGSYSLGAMPPSASANDFPAMWCTDATPVGAGYPGTPRQPNIACPVTIQ
ncbi:MAG: lamin tail domain-containing protein [Deltaproteobacteria bacterium]|nr:lamin tail domain-containing protein [Deltaproteobacteria bacterium]